MKSNIKPSKNRPKKWDEKKIKALLIDHIIKENQDESLICAEVPLLGGKRWVDILEIKNGSLIAYEIKSDLDSFINLQNQLADYQDIFNEIYVVLSKKFIRKYMELPKQIGCFVLEPNEEKITLKRQAKKKIHLSKEKLSYFLWKKDLPIHFRRCQEPVELIRDRFIKHSTGRSMHNLAIQALKKRYTDRFKLFLKEKSQRTHFSEISVLTKKEIYVC